MIPLGEDELYFCNDYLLHVAVEGFNHWSSTTRRLSHLGHPQRDTATTHSSKGWLFRCWLSQIECIFLNWISWFSLYTKEMKSLAFTQYRSKDFQPDAHKRHLTSDKKTFVHDTHYRPTVWNVWRSVNKSDLPLRSPILYLVKSFFSFFFFLLHV